VKLGRQINWTVFEERLGQTYAVTGGAPGVSTRLRAAAATPCKTAGMKTVT